MSEYFYVFENGSGSTWAKYIAPAAAYKLYIDNKGCLGLSSVVPSSVGFSSIQNLGVIRSDGLGDSVLRLKSSREGN